MNTLVKLLKLGLLIAAFLIALYLRSPFLASIRQQAFWFVILASLSITIFETKAFNNKYILRKSVISLLILSFASLNVFTTLGIEIKFDLAKQNILNQPPEKLEKLGQHFIVGYTEFNEVKKLVYKRAIGGIFITTRNIKNKTKEEIKQEIQALQDIRHQQGLSPLWIATDQEGGIVSRLSPPLTKLPQLSKVVEGDNKIEQKKDAVIQYASQQGKELSELGVNLNFAPVVDLNKGVINPDDKFPKIYKRAISRDKDIVAKVALWYCQTLEKYGVKCTIKHFPGLGRVNADTHLAHADLSTTVDELADDDWVPFRELMSKSQAFTMLGHAKLTAVDAKHPVSFSQTVVRGIIRNDWRHDGILITDDFCMNAVYGSEDKLRNASIKAINAGVDLILIAYDKDLYYEAMSALLRAREEGELDSKALADSRKRLEQTKNN